MFKCGLRTDPPADSIGTFYVIVLDGSGTAWSWGSATDGTHDLPFAWQPFPSGLLCRDYLANPDFVYSMGGPAVAANPPTSWSHNEDAYASVLAYWFVEGQPARMDVDNNGIPCELLFDPDTVARVWAGNTP